MGMGKGVFFCILAKVSKRAKSAIELKLSFHVFAILEKKVRWNVSVFNEMSIYSEYI